MAKIKTLETPPTPDRQGQKQKHNKIKILSIRTNKNSIHYKIEIKNYSIFQIQFGFSPYDLQAERGGRRKQGGLPVRAYDFRMATVELRRQEAKRGRQGNPSPNRTSERGERKEGRKETKREVSTFLHKKRKIMEVPL